MPKSRKRNDGYYNNESLPNVNHYMLIYGDDDDDDDIDDIDDIRTRFEKGYRERRGRKRAAKKAEKKTEDLIVSGGSGGYPTDDLSSKRHEDILDEAKKLLEERNIKVFRDGTSKRKSKRSKRKSKRSKRKSKRSKKKSKRSKRKSKRSKRKSKRSKY